MVDWSRLELLEIKKRLELFASLNFKKFESLELAAEKKFAKCHHSARGLSLESLSNRYLLSCGAEGHVNLFDVEDSSEELKPLRSVPVAHQRAITDITWYPFDLGMFTTCSLDKTVKVWDAESFDEVHSFELGHKVYSQSLSTCAQLHSLVAVGTDDQDLILCDLRSGSFSHRLYGHREAIYAVEWSPADEFLLVSGGQDQTIRFWDIRKAGPSQCLMVLDQYSSYYSNSERIYDESRVTVTLAHGKAVCGLQFTSDGMYLVSSGNDNTVRLWDVISGANMMVNYGNFVKNNVRSRVPMTLTRLQHGVCEPSLIFHPTNDSSICVFDLFNGRLLNRLIGHFQRVHAMAIRQTDKDIKLFSAADDGDILIWEELDIVEESEPEDLWEDDLYED